MDFKPLSYQIRQPLFFMTHHMLWVMPKEMRAVNIIVESFTGISEIITIGMPLWKVKIKG